MMVKLTKRILSIMLCVTLLMGSAVFAWAEELPGGINAEEGLNAADEIDVADPGNAAKEEDAAETGNEAEEINTEEANDSAEDGDKAETDTAAVNANDEKPDFEVVPAEPVNPAGDSLIKTVRPYDTATYELRYTWSDYRNEAQIIGLTGTKSGELVIPDQIDKYKVAEISQYAFNNLGAFEGGLSIPSNVGVIGEYAFHGCSFEGGLNLGKRVWHRTLHIGSHAFDNTAFTGDLTISENVGVSTYAFNNCNITGNLILEGGRERIDPFAFCNLKATGNLTIPDGVKSIGEEAFKDCTCFEGGLTIPDSVESIEDGAFEGCSGLDGNLSIGTGLTAMGNNVFKGCSGLTGDLTPGINVETIGEYAFSGTNFEGALDLASCTNLTQIGSYAFSDSAFTGDLTIRNSIEYIGQDAFKNCNMTGSLVIKNGRESIDPYAFHQLIATGELTIPDSVKTIGEGAFKECTGFEGGLTIPDNVDTIGTSAFEGCSGLDGELWIGSGMRTIADSIFKDCSGLTGTLTIQDCVEKIENDPFSGCGFTGLNLEQGIVTIGENAFKGLSSCTGQLIIPDGVQMIGESAFEGCSGFTGKLAFPNSVKTISKQAFKGCSSFSQLSIGSYVRTIGDEAFSECYGIAGKVTIPARVTSIGQSILPQVHGNSAKIVGYDSNINVIANNSVIPLPLWDTYVYPLGNEYVSDDDCRVFWKDAATDEFITEICGCQTAVLYTKEEHEHSFTYSAEGTVITASCSEDCMIDSGLSITLRAPDNLVYDGKVKAASINDDYSRIAFPGNYKIRYYQNDREISASKVKTPGNYIAEITVEGLTVAVEFTITSDLPDEEIFEDEGEYTHSRISAKLFTGSEIRPEPAIRWNNRILVKNQDYSLSYRNNINAGSAYADNAPLVIVSGMGNYNMNMEIPFDIVKKDIGSGSTYADGISVSIQNAISNGSKVIKNKPVIKYGNVVLKETTDYKLSYSPEEPVAAGTLVTVTITATEKNYTGAITATYRINDKSKDLSKANVTVTPANVPYSGGECRPGVIVKIGTEDVADSDYVLSYANNIKVGTATVTVTGKNGCSGSKSVKFKIVPKDLSESATVILSETAVYTGKALTPKICVKDGDLELPASDYTVKYTENVSAASPEHPIIKGNKQLVPTITVKFKGNYSGTAVRTFTIAPKAVVKSDLDVVFPDVLDKGADLMASDLKPTVKLGKTALKKGTDYDVTGYVMDLTDPVQHAGITLKGNYENAENMLYSFTLYSAEDDMGAAAFNVNLAGTEFLYTGSEIRPQVTSVTTRIGNKEVTLTEGKDYKVAYSNNITVPANAKKQPVCTVSGKGVYKGKKEVAFSIIPRELNRGDFTVTVPDVKWNKGKEVKPKVIVTEKATGREMASGKDYVAIFTNNTLVAEKDSEDAPTVTIYAIGNYKMPEAQKDYLAGSFRIYEKDVSALKVDNIAPGHFNNSQIIPEVVVRDGNKVLIPDDDYELDYGENRYAGTGTVIITGKKGTNGSYGGTRIVKFNILPK